MPVWRSLLVIYPELELKFAEGWFRNQTLNFTIAQDEIDFALNSYEAFPKLVSSLTQSQVTIESEIVVSDSPLKSLTHYGRGLRWPAPEDTSPQVEEHVSRRPVDSIFVLWPQNDSKSGSRIDSGGWGLGMGASPRSFGATYAVVGNAEKWVWEIPTAGEVWLHEWLHGVCWFYSSIGYKMPDGDADGGERHGYVRSPITGWMDYYRDLMSASVEEDGRLLGIPMGAWRIAPNKV